MRRSTRAQPQQIIIEPSRRPDHPPAKCKSPSSSSSSSSSPSPLDSGLVVSFDGAAEGAADGAAEGPILVGGSNGCSSSEGPPAASFAAPRGGSDDLRLGAAEGAADEEDEASPAALGRLGDACAGAGGDANAAEGGGAVTGVAAATGRGLSGLFDAEEQAAGAGARAGSGVGGGSATRKVEPRGNAATSTAGGDAFSSCCLCCSAARCSNDLVLVVSLRPELGRGVELSLSVTAGAVDAEVIGDKLGTVGGGGGSGGVAPLFAVFEDILRTKDFIVDASGRINGGLRAGARARSEQASANESADARRTSMTWYVNEPQKLSASANQKSA